MIVLVLVCLAKSCTEIRYSVWGVETKATIAGARPVTERDRVVEYSLDYRFTDEQNQTHKSFATVDANDWTMPEDRLIDIVYLPDNPKKSVLAMKRSFIPIWILVGLTVVFAIWLAHQFRLAKQGRL